MRIVKYGLAAVAAFAVVGCHKPAAKEEATPSGFVMSAAVADLNKSLGDLRKTDFKVAGAKQADIDAVIAALPKSVSVQVGGKSFDGGSGATVLTKIVITTTALPDVSLNIDELKLWGLDTGFAVARLTGQRLGDTAPLARRIEAKGVSVAGLDKAMTQLMNGLNSQMPTAARQGGEVSFSRYDVRFDRVVFDNVSLRPFALKLAELGADNPLKDAIPLLQKGAAYANSLAMDAYVYDGLTSEADMTQGEEKTLTKSSVATIAARKIAGGDTAAFIEKDVKSEVSITTPALGDKPLAVSGGAEIATGENIRFGKVLGYIATATLPPRTDTDLMSLGLYRIGPTHYTLGGKPFFDMKDATLDGTGFYWLIPTKLRFDVKEMVFHVDTLIDFVDSMNASGGAKTLSASQSEILKKYGLNAPSIDMSGGWGWDAKGGGATLDAHFRVAGWDKLDAKLGGGFPTFDQVSAQIPDSGSPSEAQQQALQKMFTDQTLLRAITFDLVDEGGAGKVFNLAADYMASDPNTPKGQAPTAKDLKDQTVNSLNEQASQMKADQPVIAAVMGAFANFLSTGEAVHIAVNPNPPVTAAEFEKLSEGDKAAIDRLNVTVNGKKP